MNYQIQVLIACLVPVVVIGLGCFGAVVVAIVQIRRGKI